MNGWLKKADDWINVNRPWALLIMVALTVGAVALINSITGSDLFRQFFFPKVCASNKPLTCDPLAWKDLFQAAILILGLPVAFLLWHWRDRNVRDQIGEQRNQVENSRKDLNLKEFQEVQLRAAGALDEKLPVEAREALQIAALHQLRGFLRGEYGESFKRPAFELLWPSSGVSILGVKSFREWLIAESISEESAFDPYTKYVDACFGRLDRVAKTRISILNDEWEFYFKADFPLQGRDFSFLNLPIDADLAKLNLSGCRFIRAGIERSKFDETNLSYTVFDRVFAAGASFKGANLLGAQIECSGLMPDNRQGGDPYSKPVDLRDANLNLSSLRHCIAYGAMLQGATLPRSQVGLTFEDAIYDDRTTMNLGLVGNRDIVVEQLRKLSAKHEKELEKE